ncbi:unnamed protein product [Rotaria sordida]|uniref:Band 7 domain-containing protein n=1 Tax=Rotaria sordida TaxID=392033 RepID=A0A814ZYN1_9BILA|nr:unnamed protein product [Rotaria sordida]CAF1514421.1 unnamed protein product [Rotaria sordida]
MHKLHFIIFILDLQTLNITLHYEERVLPSIINESQFDAIELITQHTLISQRVSELLTERAAQFSLLLDDISITHLSFRPEFTSAVELKQVVQQDVEKQRFLAEKTDQSRQANVIAAEGDARAADLIGKALDEAGDGLIELRQIEAAEGIANQLSKSRNSVYLPYGPQMLFNITGNQNYINARFSLPLANYLPHLVPSQIATAHFQLVLPCDRHFGIDSIPIEICYAGTGDHGFSRRRLFTAVPLINQYSIGSILLENPYYGLRKPSDQSRSSLLYVTDLCIMGKTLVLLHWCQKMKLTPAILHGFSLGGHMASLASTKWSDPPCQQFYKNKASQTFYDYLRERDRSIDSNKIVLNLIKDMMRLLMDEFISLYNYSRSVQPNISDMNDVWPGIHIRYAPHGHVSVFLFNQSDFHHAAAKMLQRQESNVKLKKHLIISPISVTTPKNS